MTSSFLLKNFSDHVALNENEQELLMSVLINRPYKRGEVLIKAGEQAHYMMFVNSGYLMTSYTDANGSDHVVQLTAAGWWSGDIYSTFDQLPTPYTTKALTDGEVLLLPRLVQTHLLQSNIIFERYFRIVFQKVILRQQRRYLEAVSTSAEERYRSFIKAYPNIAAEVHLKHIASYLAITPEFLSKIRRKIAGLT